MCAREGRCAWDKRGPRETQIKSLKMSPHTVLLCDTGHYSPYYSQPFTTLITWKILRSNCLWGCAEKNTHTYSQTYTHKKIEGSMFGVWRVRPFLLGMAPCTQTTDNSNISKKQTKKDKYTKSSWSFWWLLLRFVNKDAHWTPAGSQHAIRASMWL